MGKITAAHKQVLQKAWMVTRLPAIDLRLLLSHVCSTFHIPQKEQIKTLSNDKVRMFKVVPREGKRVMSPKAAVRSKRLEKKRALYGVVVFPPMAVSQSELISQSLIYKVLERKKEPERSSSPSPLGGESLHVWFALVRLKGVGPIKLIAITDRKTLLTSVAVRRRLRLEGIPELVKRFFETLKGAGPQQQEVVFWIPDFVQGDLGEREKETIDRGLKANGFMSATYVDEPAFSTEILEVGLDMSEAEFKEELRKKIKDFHLGSEGNGRPFTFHQLKKLRREDGKRLSVKEITALVKRVTFC